MLSREWRTRQDVRIPERLEVVGEMVGVLGVVGLVYAWDRRRGGRTSQARAEGRSIVANRLRLVVDYFLWSVECRSVEWRVVFALRAEGRVWERCRMRRRGWRARYRSY